MEYLNKGETSVECAEWCRLQSVRSFFGCVFCLSFIFNFFLILKSAKWKECDKEKVQLWNSRNLARAPRTSKMESFAKIFNGFVNYCCKALNLRCLWGSWLHPWKKVQQEKNVTCEECNRRRMQNGNLATCKSATWNRAIPKRSATRKCIVKRLLHRKMPHGNGTVWKNCNMKRV